MWSDPADRLRTLRGLLALLAAGRGRERAAELIEIGGELFDEGNLDGQQYHAVYALHEAVTNNAPNVRELAETCLALI